MQHCIIYGFFLCIWKYYVCIGQFVLDDEQISLQFRKSIEIKLYSIKSNKLLLKFIQNFLFMILGKSFSGMENFRSNVMRCFCAATTLLMLITASHNVFQRCFHSIWIKWKQFLWKHRWNSHDYRQRHQMRNHKKEFTANIKCIPIVHSHTHIYQHFTVLIRLNKCIHI